MEEIIQAIKEATDSDYQLYYLEDDFEKARYIKSIIRKQLEKEKEQVYRVYGYYNMDICQGEEIIQEIYATEELAQKRCKELIAQWKQNGYTKEDCVNPDEDWIETETSLFAYVDSEWNVAINYKLEDVLSEMAEFPHCNC